MEPKSKTAGYIYKKINQYVLQEVFWGRMNMPQGVILREFKYFDKQIVEDFLSSIEGGLATESRLSSTIKNGRMGGEIGLPFAKVSAQKSAIDVINEETKTLGGEAALFQRLYTMLSNLNMIKHQSEMDTIKQGDIIELTGTAELPFFDKISDLLGQFLPLIQVMQPQTVDPKALAGFSMLTKNESLNVRVSISSETKVIAILRQKNLRGSKQELEDDYTGLYRVKRILKPNETFNILQVPTKFDEPTIDNFIKTFSKMPDNITLGRQPVEADLQVHYPAIILKPVAIYQ